MIFATDIALLNNWNIFFIYFLLYIPVLIWLKMIYSFGFLFLSWIGIATFLFMVFCCVPISSGKSRNINQYSCIDKISVRRHNQYFSTCTSKINIWSLLSNVWHKGEEGWYRRINSYRSFRTWYLPLSGCIRVIFSGVLLSFLILISRRTIVISNVTPHRKRSGVNL